MQVRIIWLMALPVALVLLAVACGEEAATPTPESGQATSMTFPNKIVAPHFVDSYPTHGDTLTQLPQELVLNFNFNLHADSAITLTRDVESVDLGQVTITPNQLSMRASIDEATRDGVYQADYDACWPDRSCHEGSIAFIVRSPDISEYQDLSGQSEITVRMKDEKLFDPARMVLSSGTKVTWINDDEVAHFVNTDPHPSHNVLGDLNSLAINPGESYTYTFEEPGAWGYHCSAHYNLGMVAQVVVK